MYLKLGDTIVHVRRESDQPATRFVDVHGPKPFTVRMRRRRQIFTDCCRRRRWAAYVRVQVYYDEIHRFCADGHGCRTDRRKGR